MTHHPFSSILRQRSAHLRGVADRIEQSLVMTLEQAPSDLARRLLDRNLHQLHVVIEDLRDTSFRLVARADELDHSTAAA